MKCLYLFVVITVCQGFEIKIDELPAPDLIRLTAIEPHGFVVEWNSIQNLNAQDPVVGYKVKIWQEEMIKTYRYEMKDGVNVLVEEDKPASYKPIEYLPYKIPDTKPTEIVIHGGDKTKAEVDNIKFNVEYEIRVQAFTDKEVGPLSKPMKIKLMKNNKSHDKDIYTVS